MIRKKQIMFAILTILLLSTVGVVIRYIATEHQKTNIAAEYGIKYVREHYKQQSELKVTAACHPFFGSGMHEVAIKALNDERYYLYTILKVIKFP